MKIMVILIDLVIALTVLIPTSYCAGWEYVVFSFLLKQFDKTTPGCSSVFLMLSGVFLLG